MLIFVSKINNVEADLCIQLKLVSDLIYIIFLVVIVNLVLNIFFSFFVLIVYIIHFEYKIFYIANLSQIIMCVILGGTILSQPLSIFRPNLNYQCLLPLIAGWLTQKK